MTDSKVVRNAEYCEISFCVGTRRLCTKRAGFSIGYVGLSLGPQDPRGPPANCGTHRVSCRYCIWSIR